MATNKKRIQAYVEEEIIPKFRIITALKGYKSMSEYAGELIEQSIEEYETQHGPIKVNEGGGVKIYKIIRKFTLQRTGSGRMRLKIHRIVPQNKKIEQ